MNFLRIASCLVLFVAGFSPALAADRLNPSVRALVSADEPLKVAVDRGFAVRDGRVQVVVLATKAGVEHVERWLSDRGALFVFSFGARIQAFFPADLVS